MNESSLKWLDRIVPHVREMKGVRLWSFIKRVHTDALYAVLESLADEIIELERRLTELSILYASRA